jgi:carboxyl-terminal processing protease
MKVTALHCALLCTITIASLQACKKEDLSANVAPSPKPPTPVSVSDKLKDSSLAYARDIYLWYNQIPASFDVKSYEDLNKLMTGIRQYSTEPGFTQPVDRWSFAIKRTEWDNISAGIAGDFGISVFFMAPGDLRIKYVEKESPASKAGIRRGWHITKVAESADITSSNADFLVSKIYNSSSTAFTFQKPDNNTVDITLTAATYLENPVFFRFSIYGQHKKDRLPVL